MNSHRRKEHNNEDSFLLIKTVSDMEIDQPVQLGPLTSRLWELKKDYRLLDITNRAVADAMQARESRFIYEC